MYLISILFYIHGNEYKKINVDKYMSMIDELPETVPDMSFLDALINCNVLKLEYYKSINHSVHNGCSGKDCIFPLYVAVKNKDEKIRTFQLSYLIDLMKQNVKINGSKELYCIESELPNAYTSLIKFNDWNNIINLFYATANIDDITLLKLKKKSIDTFNIIINQLDYEYVKDFLKDNAIVISSKKRHLFKPKKLKSFNI